MNTSSTSNLPHDICKGLAIGFGVGSLLCTAGSYLKHGRLLNFNFTEAKISYKLREQQIRRKLKPNAEENQVPVLLGAPEGLKPKASLVLKTKDLEVRDVDIHLINIPQPDTGLVPEDSEEFIHFQSDPLRPSCPVVDASAPASVHSCLAGKDLQNLSVMYQIIASKKKGDKGHTLDIDPTPYFSAAVLSAGFSLICFASKALFKTSNK